MITNFNKSFIGYLLLCYFASAIKIEKLVVPELVQIGNVSEIILDCQFTEALDEGPYKVEWFFNGNNVPVYQWSPHSLPKVNGILVGRLELTFRVSPSVYLYDEGRTLRIIRLGPELSGEYTCSVERNGTKVQQTKAMLVFSPEREFDLKVEQRSENKYDVMCNARGVFPPPDIILEYKNKLIPRQQQRMWRSSDNTTLYDAESVTQLEVDCPGTVTCRLVLSEAGYIAMKEKAIYTDIQCVNRTGTTRKLPVIYICVAIIIYLYTHT